MSTYPRRGRRRPRRGYGRIVLPLLLLVGFAVGLALGEALEDNPRQGQTVTHEQVLTLRPASTTVTVTAP